MNPPCVYFDQKKIEILFVTILDQIFAVLFIDVSLTLWRVEPEFTLIKGENDQNLNG